MAKLIALSKGKERNVNIIEATFSHNGELIPLRVNEDDRPEAYCAITKLLGSQTPGSDIASVADELLSIMSPEVLVSEQISSSFYLSNSMKISNGKLYFGEHRLEETLAKHMLSLLNDNNEPKDEKLWKSYVKFLDNLHQNASEDIRKQLFRWMDYENEAGNGFGITEDGCFVGYKGCSGTILNPVSVKTGHAIVNGEEFNGHIPNTVGSVIQMPRSAVQHDPSVGCSQGLHVGTRDYATQWAPILLLVKVNPRDVVSVPYECDSQKMRVCEYTILEVTDATSEHKRFHAFDDVDDLDVDDVEEIFEETVLTEDDAYDFLDDESLLYIEYSVDGDTRSAYGLVDEVLENDEETSIVVYDEVEGDVEIKLSEITYFTDETEFLLSTADALYLQKNETEVEVQYEGKNHTGIIGEVFKKLDKEPGVIVRSEDGVYKHIKLHKITDWREVDTTPIPPKSFESVSQYDKNVDENFSNIFKEEKTVEGENDLKSALDQIPLGSLLVVNTKNERQKPYSGKLISLNYELGYIIIKSTDSTGFAIMLEEIESIDVVNVLK